MLRVLLQECVLLVSQKSKFDWQCVVQTPRISVWSGASPFGNPTSAVILERFINQSIEMTRFEIAGNLPIPSLLLDLVQPRVKSVNLGLGQLENLLLDHLELTHA